MATLISSHQGEQPLHRALHLPVVGIRDLQQHLLQAAGFLADPNHVHGEGGKHLALHQRVRQAFALLGAFRHVVQGERHGPIVQRLPDDGKGAEQ